MGYIEQTLQEGEEIIGRATARFHGKSLPPLLFLVGTFFIWIGIDVNDPAEPIAMRLMFIIAALFYVGGICYYIWVAKVTKRSEFVVTNKRVFLRGFRRNTNDSSTGDNSESFEIPIDQIQTVVADEKILTITNKNGDKVTYTAISDPLAFRQSIMDQIDKSDSNQ